MLKIKFLDTGEELEVTDASMLHNTCFEAETAHDIQFIESLGFKLWAAQEDGGNFIRLWDDNIYSAHQKLFTTRQFRMFAFLPSEPLTTPDNEPVSQPSAKPGQEDGWISVEDRMPEIYESVLLWAGYMTLIGNRDHTGWAIPKFHTPSHWHPLPAPPKTQNS